MSIILITRTLILTTLFVFFGFAKNRAHYPIPSPSERILDDGQECINTSTHPLSLLACFIPIINELNTNTLKSRTFRSLATFFYKNEHRQEGNIAMASAKQYQIMAESAPNEEANILQKEAHELEKNEEYTRLMNLLFKFKNSSLAPLDAIIQHYAENSEHYAKKILKDSTTPNDIITAYQILTQRYLLTDDFYQALFITRAAINTINDYKANSRFFEQYQYFEKQHQFCQIVMDSAPTLR